MQIAHSSGLAKRSGAPAARAAARARAARRSSRTRARMGHTPAWAPAWAVAQAAEQYATARHTSHFVNSTASPENKSGKRNEDLDTTAIKMHAHNRLYTGQPPFRSAHTWSWRTAWTSRILPAAAERVGALRRPVRRRRHHRRACRRWPVRRRRHQPRHRLQRHRPRLRGGVYPAGHRLPRSRDLGPASYLARPLLPTFRSGDRKNGTAPNKVAGSTMPQNRLIATRTCGPMLRAEVSDGVGCGMNLAIGERCIVIILFFFTRRRRVSGCTSPVHPRFGKIFSRVWCRGSIWYSVYLQGL